ncbi:hypothetical protein ACFTY8_01015 [Streptomyces mirabilis]|uniref:hypothetical protein n=1 Tax=Streptomyces mirabilis TaxID=68239 RepID=UPI003626AF75
MPEIVNPNQGCLKRGLPPSRDHSGSEAEGKRAPFAPVGCRAVSECQYYEFLAVDRPLTKAEIAQVRALSTRARITSTGFVNEYHWGDFRGDPTKLVEQLYDAHLYYANWGSRRLLRHVQAQPDRSAAMSAVDTTWPVRVSGR